MYLLSKKVSSIEERVGNNPKKKSITYNLEKGAHPKREFALLTVG